MLSALCRLQRTRVNPAVSGANKPVRKELFTKELKVEGAIPQELNGVYLRTGPNPPHAPAGGHHVYALLVLVMRAVTARHLSSVANACV